MPCQVTPAEVYHSYGSQSRRSEEGGIAQKLGEEAAICGDVGGPYTWDEYRGQALERGA